MPETVQASSRKRWASRSRSGSRNRQNQGDHQRHTGPSTLLGNMPSSLRDPTQRVIVGEGIEYSHLRGPSVGHRNLALRIVPYGMEEERGDKKRDKTDGECNKLMCNLLLSFSLSCLFLSISTIVLPHFQFLSFCLMVFFYI